MPRKVHVVGSDLPNHLDDVFWMLPFSSMKQLHIVQQEKSITDYEWQKLRDHTAEQRFPDAQAPLLQGRKIG